MSYNDFSNDASKTKENVNDIKKDMKTLMNNLKGIGSDSLGALTEEFDNMTSHMKDLGYKSKQTVENGVEYFNSSTREHPTRNLAIAFIGGAVMAMLLRK